jgi:hypothetical protein
MLDEDVPPSPEDELCVSGLELDEDGIAELELSSEEELPLPPDEETADEQLGISLELLSSPELLGTTELEL